MSPKRLVMIKKLTEEDVKAMQMTDVMIAFEFAIQCLWNIHMPHDRETLRHNVKMLEPKYDLFMEYLDE